MADTQEQVSPDGMTLMMGLSYATYARIRSFSSVAYCSIVDAVSTVSPSKKLGYPKGPTSSPSKHFIS
jgi:hypothetical protein